MARRLPPLRAGLLLPAGLLAVRCSSTNGARERVTSEGDGTTSSNSDAGSTQSIANKLAAELESELAIEDESVSQALRRLSKKEENNCPCGVVRMCVILYSGTLCPFSQMSSRPVERMSRRPHG